MIIFNLVVFFNSKVPLFFYFLRPLCLFFGGGVWWLIFSLLFLISFVYLFFFPCSFCWGGLGYIFVFWWFICSLFFLISFVYLFFFPYYFCWGGLGYIFGCDLISHGLILFSLWICVLMVLVRVSIFCLGYFSGFFLFVLIVLGDRNIDGKIILKRILKEESVLI